jgi:hypothetical protein
MVRGDEIARVLGAADGDPHHAAEALIGAANAAGGEDNVTVVLFEVLEGEPAERSARASDGSPPRPSPADPDEETSETVVDGVRRHGAGKGSRWPALLLVLTLLAIAAFAVWWSLLR